VTTSPHLSESGYLPLKVHQLLLYVATLREKILHHEVQDVHAARALRTQIHTHTHTTHNTHETQTQTQADTGTDTDTHTHPSAPFRPSQGRQSRCISRTRGLFCSANAAGHAGRGRAGADPYRQSGLNQRKPYLKSRGANQLTSLEMDEGSSLKPAMPSRAVPAEVVVIRCPVQ
jgi:hypothetical protein